MLPTVIDCQGLPCPRPVMLLLTLLKGERPSTLEVIVDNQAAFENVTRFLRSRGYTTEHTEADGLWRVCAREDSGEGLPAPSTTGGSATDGSTTGQAGTGGRDSDELSGYGCAPAVTPATQAFPTIQPEDLRTLVMIVSPVLGSGDDELGGKLMKNFLLTLPEMGSTLWRIVMLNGGVTLTAQNSPVLEQLQALERAGVSILVCGACLEHFGLLSQKAVGETTNMLDIVSSMQAAYKVIRV